MNCKTKWIGWMLHRWKSILWYPPMLSDGAGDCWAGHLISECQTCGLKQSAGIYAAEDLGGGKVWGRMRSANAEELKEHGLSR
jgi:hypothetical protein